MRRVKADSDADWPRARRMVRGRFAFVCAFVCLGALLLLGGWQHARAEAPSLTFAIASNVLDKPAGETSLQQMLDAIGRERNTSFIVYDGNLKGETEPCRDSLYNTREQIFDTSRKPVVLLPGGNDWASCGLAQAGSYDPVERLDFVRQLFFGDSNSLGQTPMNVIRESDVARFRPFRENVRWQSNGVAFIGLNAPAPNNHYLSAGGRNGEFEDRSIANAFWLEHAVETARRSDMRAVVVILQGDPDFARYERRDRFAWLRFSRGETSRDGFLELKRSLVKAAELFRGPVIVIHQSDTPIPRGFRIDQPLRNDKGTVVANLTRIAMGLKKPQSQWLEVESDIAWRPPFRVRVRDVIVRPATPGPASAPAVPASSLAPSSSIPGIEDDTSGPSSFFQQMLPVTPAQPTQQLPASQPGTATPASNAASSVPPILNSNSPANLPPILPLPSNPASGASGTGTGQ
ncbi:hypothetical protein [Caballeronia mineralivorans]|nr:hypothetical protein [Caballeronia mineralivorans]